MQNCLLPSPLHAGSAQVQTIRTGMLVSSLSHARQRERGRERESTQQAPCPTDSPSEHHSSAGPVAAAAAAAGLEGILVDETQSEAQAGTGMRCCTAHPGCMSHSGRLCPAAGWTPGHANPPVWWSLGLQMPHVSAGAFQRALTASGEGRPIPVAARWTIQGKNVKEIAGRLQQNEMQLASPSNKASVD